MWFFKKAKFKFEGVLAAGELAHKFPNVDFVEKYPGGIALPLDADALLYHGNNYVVKLATSEQLKGIISPDCEYAVVLVKRSDIRFEITLKGAPPHVDVILELSVCNPAVFCACFLKGASAYERDVKEEILPVLKQSFAEILAKQAPRMGQSLSQIKESVSDGLSNKLNSKLAVYGMQFNALINYIPSPDKAGIPMVPAGQRRVAAVVGRSADTSPESGFVAAADFTLQGFDSVGNMKFSTEIAGSPAVIKIGRCHDLQYRYDFPKSCCNAKNKEECGNHIILNDKRLENKALEKAQGGNLISRRAADLKITKNSVVLVARKGVAQMVPGEELILANSGVWFEFGDDAPAELKSRWDYTVEKDEKGEIKKVVLIHKDGLKGAALPENAGGSVAEGEIVRYEITRRN